MRTIDVSLIENKIEKLFIEANYILPDDVKKKIDESINKEKSQQANSILNILKQNYQKAEEMIYPLCQDTGLATVFLEIGQDINFMGGYLIDAINTGVANAYQKGYLRKSIVKDPFNRKNTSNNLPAIIHTEITRGDKLKITAVPKGFGSENQSNLKMFLPTDDKDKIIDFIVNGIINAGGKGCPPCIIGIGIGGNFEYAPYLAKKALLLPLDESNPDPFYASMEEDILSKINSSNVGSMGIGGNITCLGVRILAFPTHIAGLPVAYNYSCHACRHKSIII